jgi:hypothetical protein
MNEQLQNVLTDLIVTATAAKDFVLSELPDVINQLLMWKMIESIIYTFIGVAMLGCIAAYWLVLYKHWDRWKEIGSDPEFAFFFPGGVATLLLFVGACFVINITWLQILIAPKVYLIEYAASLAK